MHNTLIKVTKSKIDIIYSKQWKSLPVLLAIRIKTWFVDKTNASKFLGNEVRN